jgi:hypothetical protein
VMLNRADDGVLLSRVTQTRTTLASVVH